MVFEEEKQLFSVVGYAMAVKFIDDQVLKIMHLLAFEGDFRQLNQWLKDCTAEIARRTQCNEKIHPLQYEKNYLEILCK